MHREIRDVLPVSKYCLAFKHFVTKNPGGTSEKIVQYDQDRIGVKIVVNGKVLIMCLGKAIYGSFWCQGGISWGLRWLVLKGGGPITGAYSRVGLTSSP